MLDVSKLKTGGTRAWVSIVDEFRVQFTHISQDEYEALKESCQVREEKDGQLTKELDETEFRHKLAERVTTNWDGLVDGDDPYPCVPDNIHFISDKVTEYRIALFDKPLSLTRMLEAEREEQKKS